MGGIIILFSYCHDHLLVNVCLLLCLRYCFGRMISGPEARLCLKCRPSTRTVDLYFGLATPVSAHKGLKCLPADTKISKVRMTQDFSRQDLSHCLTITYLPAKLNSFPMSCCRCNKSTKCLYSINSHLRINK